MYCNVQYIDVFNYFERIPPNADKVPDPTGSSSSSILPEITVVVNRLVKAIQQVTA